MKKKYGVFIGFAVLLIAAAFIFAACSDPNNDKKDDPAKVATPVASPGAGAVDPGTSVTLTSSTTGAEIRYTTDGTAPTATTGTVYSTPISITVAATIKAIAVKSGMTDSDVLTAVYTLTPPKFTAGTYTGTGRGYNAIPIVLSVTVDAYKITGVAVTSNNESNNSLDGSSAGDRNISGGTYASVGAAWPHLKTLFVNRSSSKLSEADLDTFTGATLSTRGFSMAVANALEQATAEWRTGTFNGSGTGYSNRNGSGSDIALTVTLDATGITAITVTGHQESTGADYPSAGMGVTVRTGVKEAFDKFAGLEGETSLFAGNKSSYVDVITGATYTTRGFRSAVADALEKARQ